MFVVLIHVSFMRKIFSRSQYDVACKKIRIQIYILEKWGIESTSIQVMHYVEEKPKIQEFLLRKFLLEYVIKVALFFERQCK